MGASPTPQRDEHEQALTLNSVNGREPQDNNLGIFLRRHSLV